MDPINITVVIERDTADPSGAGARFQVIEIQDEDGDDLTHLVDQGVFYASVKALAKELPRQYSIVEVIEA